MKYVPPYGIADPDAPYINGDPSIARQGSIPPAEAFEHPMRELVAVIENSMIAPSELDLGQVAKGVRSQRMNYVEDTGSINTLSVALDPPVVTYTVGLPLRVKIKNTNTGPATIDAGAGRVSVKKPNGAEMGPGDLPAAGLAEMVYDGSHFQMINFGGAGGGPGDVFQVNIPYTVDTSPTANTIIANFSPAVGALTAGLIVMVKIANTNTSFSNININGLGLKPVYAQGSTAAYPLLPSDLVAGDVLIFIYDGMRFWIYANDILNQTVTFNVANNTQFSDLFYALGRKRILSQAFVTIKMGTGIYTPIYTSHPNSDRIKVQGTMLSTRPTLAEYAKTGNTPAARAQDSSNNIAMLRNRFGTEIRSPNTNAGGAVNHGGGGAIIFEDLLITGDNVSAGTMNTVVRGVNPQPGSSVICNWVTCWGIGGYWGFFAGGGEITCNSCVATNCVWFGYGAAVGGAISCWACGSFGNGYGGASCDRGSAISYHTGIGPGGATGDWSSQILYNAYYGFTVAILGQVSLDGTAVWGNGSIDLYASNMGSIGSSGGAASSFSITSPPVGTVGNGNAYIMAGI